MAIIKCGTKREGGRKSRQINTEIEEIHSNQAVSQKAKDHDKIWILNFQEYVNLKVQLLLKFQEGTTKRGENQDRKSEMNEMIVQEINLLMQLLENK